LKIISRLLYQSPRNLCPVEVFEGFTDYPKRPVVIHCGYVNYYITEALLQAK